MSPLLCGSVDKFLRQMVTLGMEIIFGVPERANKAVKVSFDWLIDYVAVSAANGREYVGR